MAQDVAKGEARLDAHSIEQIPEADRDSTGWQQFWVWPRVDIAPINWILGALGIVLGLGLTETILVIVLGNIVGCAIFASLTVMGHKTGVNQMVLSRAPFGRRGGYLSSWMQFLLLTPGSGSTPTSRWSSPSPSWGTSGSAARSPSSSSWLPSS